MNFVQPIRKRSDIEAIKKVLRDGSERNWMLFVAGANTGLRISDLLKLRARDVQGKHIVLVEKKTKKRKQMPVNPAMQRLFKSYTRGKDGRVHLFQSRKGTNQPLGRSGAYSVLRKAAEIVGIPHIGTHTLRKTFGYHMYKSNKDIATLMKIYNHTNPAVTLRYIGIDQDEMDSAVNNLELL